MRQARKRLPCFGEVAHCEHILPLVESVLRHRPPAQQARASGGESRHCVCLFCPRLPPLRRYPLQSLRDRSVYRCPRALPSLRSSRRSGATLRSSALVLTPKRVNTVPDGHGPEPPCYRGGSRGRRCRPRRLRPVPSSGSFCHRPLSGSACGAPFEKSSDAIPVHFFR